MRVRVRVIGMEVVWSSEVARMDIKSVKSRASIYANFPFSIFVPNRGGVSQAHSSLDRRSRPRAYGHSRMSRGTVKSGFLSVVFSRECSEGWMKRKWAAFQSF